MQTGCDRSAFAVSNDLFLCTTHGGGHRCQEISCTKHVRGQTGFCVEHGPRCQVKGCGKGVRSAGRCSAHGGGPRCQVEGCNKGAKTGGLCIGHGGGRRCQVEGCNKGARTGGRCKFHEPRCQVEGCDKRAKRGGRCSSHRVVPIRENVRIKFRRCYDCIQNDSKNIEGRPAMGRCLKWKIGDIIEFVHGRKKCLKRIVNIFKYTTLKKMLMYEGIKHCLPYLCIDRDCDIDDAIAEYINLKISVDTQMLAFQIKKL